MIKVYIILNYNVEFVGANWTGGRNKSLQIEHSFLCNVHFFGNMNIHKRDDLKYNEPFIDNTYCSPGNLVS